ncbi:hypothetical protein IMSAGC013_00015 [Lachnospiraceae bacterium]|nr:hypothetical protein IMSAGC013_00015 [Lachnospiraceae bacterium]
MLEQGKEGEGPESIYGFLTCCSMVCNNICPADLELSGSLPKGKGIGISSILAICQKYDGNLEYKINSSIANCTSKSAICSKLLGKTQTFSYNSYKVSKFLSEPIFLK